VAEGVLDGYLDCGVDAHGPWDYLAAMFIAREAGAMVSDLYGRELVADRYQDRRTPVAGATATLCGEIVRASNAVVERTR
jgi:fructose-1,6-bisphosphatase/inositol monophosphatase family enzyme